MRATKCAAAPSFETHRTVGKGRLCDAPQDEADTMQGTLTNDLVQFLGVLRPAEPAHDRATHHPVLVLLGEERQFLGEMGDALLVGEFRESVDAGGEVRAPETPARPEAVEHPLDVVGEV